MGEDIYLKKGPDGVALESGEPNIKVYMQSRLPNPHYIPEVQAQTTLVNFTDASQLHRDREGPRGPAAKHGRGTRAARPAQGGHGAWRQPAVPPRDRRYTNILANEALISTSRRLAASAASGGMRARELKNVYAANIPTYTMGGDFNHFG